MDEELDPSVIKATQVSLGKYVKRPPLTEKLLRKPPFRFLHDIVTSVLKSKGFFDGLFEEHELISDNVKDRESKILFLNKVISVVSLTTGQTLSAKPSKIVAGQEAAKTNELLQCLAQALDKNLSSLEAVKQFRDGVKILSINEKNSNEPKESKPNKKSIDSKKLSSKSSEKLATKNKNSQLSKSKHKENAVSKKESPPKKTLPKEIHKKLPERSNKEVLPQDHPSQNRNEEKNKVYNKIVTDKIGEDDIEQNKLLDSNNSLTLSMDSKLNESIIQSEINLQEDSLKHTINNLEKPATLEDELNSAPIAENKSISVDNIQISIDKKENDQKTNVNNELLINTKTSEIKFNEEEYIEKHNNDEKVKVSEEQPKTMHLPYDIKGKSDATAVRLSTVRPSSSRPSAPRHRDKSDTINDTENVIIGKVNIISENALQEEEEDTSIIMDNQIQEGLQDMQENEEHNEITSNKNSHLVQQILDAHKEYSQMSGKTEIEWQIGTQKTPDVFIQEMEQLRFSVQAMSRIANPLGKLLDHIQEDVEVMRQELQQWTNLYEETSKDLMKQKTAYEESLGPFHTKLKQLSTDIEEKRDKIMDLKVSIHKNASKIEKLLANGNVQ